MAGLTERWKGSASVGASVGREYPIRMGSVLCDVVYALNHRPLGNVVSPTARIYCESGIELGVAPLTITANKPLAEFLHLAPAT